jgi:hypothetical protein
MYKDYLDKIAEEFVETISKANDTNKVPTEDFGWKNWRFTSKYFRMAHVERYSDSKLEVLHVTTFPHKWSPEPIFGFDVIASDKKPLGCYMDFTPVLKHYDIDYGHEWTTTKELPEWATVFSEKFLIVTPKDEEEFQRFCDMGILKYNAYLTHLSYNTGRDNERKIVEIQNKYCEVQSSNPRTYNVLKNKVGETRAAYFIKEILFPKIK